MRNKKNQDEWCTNPLESFEPSCVPILYRYIPLFCVSPIAVHDEANMLGNWSRSEDLNHSPSNGRQCRSVRRVQEVGHPERGMLRVLVVLALGGRLSIIPRGAIVDHVTGSTDHFSSHDSLSLALQQNLPCFLDPDLEATLRRRNDPKYTSRSHSSVHKYNTKNHAIDPILYKNTTKSPTMFPITLHVFTERPGSLLPNSQSFVSPRLGLLPIDRTLG